MLSQYIGIPYVVKGREYAGCDCWGILCLYFKDELGITIDPLSTLYTEVKDLNFMENVIQYQKEQWINEEEWEEVKSPKKNDIVIFKIKGHPVHCGIVLDSTRFLHNLHGSNSCVEKYNGIKWRKRIEGFYRYRGKC